MDIKDFENLWRQNRSDKAGNIGFWDSRAEEFNKSTNREDSKKRMETFVGFLKGKGMLKEDFTVLDIGCGPGKHSVELGKIAKSVTGIDISPKMIEFARENANDANLKNVDFKVVDWEDIDIANVGWNKKFDLVIASMSPAINSRQSLEKMIECSKGYCFLSNFAQRHDELKGWIWSCLINPDILENDVSPLELSGKNIRPEHGNNAYCSFNILWQLGYFPEITYIDNRWEREMTIQEAFSYYSMYLALDIEIDNSKKEIIRKCLEKVAENGIVTEKIKSKIAWISWKV